MIGAVQTGTSRLSAVTLSALKLYERHYLMRVRSDLWFSPPNRRRATGEGMWCRC